MDAWETSAQALGLTDSYLQQEYHVFPNVCSFVVISHLVEICALNFEFSYLLHGHRPHQFDWWHIKAHS